MSHYLGDYTALCKNCYGQKMYVDTRDLSLTPHLLDSGTWEMWITEAIKPFVKNATFIDVGANVGWYSLFAEHFGARKVAAFEPNPRTRSLLEKTMRVNGYAWDIRAEALSDESGKKSLNFDFDLLGSASLCEGVGDTYVSVKTILLDHLVEAVAHVPYVIKLDVEGFEARAILGAKDLIKNRKCTLFVEHHADPNDERRVKDMLDFMEGCGYSLGHIQTDGTIKNITRADIASIPDVDMLSFQRYPK